MEKISTIRVKQKTKERLESFGRFGESHDDLLNRLIGAMEKRRKHGSAR